MLRLLSHLPNAPDAGTDWFWQLDGRNKRDIVLDLKDAAGIEILRQLVGECDVFITNQPYPVRESLGLTYEVLNDLKPDMIYASLTAYGEQGPERDRKGFDQLAYWARSGLMDLMRAPDTRPTQGLAGMGDHPTGVALYAGIVTALLHKERTGEGSFVHTSLLANGLWSAAGIAQGAMAGGDMPTYRANSRDYGISFRPYQAADGRWLQFNMVRNEELLSLAFTAMECVELLVDPRFSSLELMWVNRVTLGDAIAQVIGQRSSEDWLARFKALDVPVNRIALVEETVDDPQIHLNNMVLDATATQSGVPRVINHPIQIEGIPCVGPRRAPDLGEHRVQILVELGYSQAQIEELVERGVI